MEEFLKTVEECIASKDEARLKKLLEDRKDIFKSKPLIYINSEVMFYMSLGNSLKAYEVINRYLNEPYINIEVEEYLQESLKALMTINEKKHDIEENLEPMLMSNKVESIMAALDYISKNKPENYLDLMQKFLLFGEELYRPLGLILLVEARINKIFEMDKNGQIYEVNPSVLDLPNESIYFLDFMEELKKSTLEENIQNDIVDLFNKYVIITYPDSLEEYEADFLLDVFVEIRKKIINEKVDISTILKNYNHPEKEVDLLIENIYQTIIPLLG